LGWTEFVRQNLSDDARIRSVIRVCIYNQTQASTRLIASIKTLLPQVTSSPNARILVIGRSDPINDARTAIASVGTPHMYTAKFEDDLAVRRVTRHSEIGQLRSSDLLASPSKYHFDLILLPCAMLSTTGRKEIRVVQWAQHVQLAKAMRATGAPLIVVGDPQQIWSPQLYRRSGDYAAELRKQEFDAGDTILDDKDIDWLILDRQAIDVRTPWPAAADILLNNSSFDVGAALVLCERSPSFDEATKRQLREIDRKLSLVHGVPFYEQVELFDRFEVGPHTVSREWHPTMLREALPRFSTDEGRVSAPDEEQDMRRSFKVPSGPDKPVGESTDNIHPRARPQNIDWEKLRRASRERENRILDELANLYTRAGFGRE
jgi:hypothetical protein